MARRSVPLLFLLLLGLGGTLSAQQLQFAELGDCQLESGQVIKNCRLEYRTIGDLRGKGENAVLFPTWFSGSTEDLLQYAAKDSYLDPSKYFVILVGAFGDGFSSSPSNSRQQAEKAFPAFTIGDMVKAQHRFLTEKLGLERLHAVMGISMGGMQTFQWIVSFPNFMERAIPIVGSPRLDSYDLLLWHTELNAIEEAQKAYDDPAQARRAGMRLASDIHNLAISSPQEFNHENTRAGLDGVMATKEADLVNRYDPNDWASQLRAMISLDATKPFGGSYEQAAATVRAKVLVVASAQDHMVTPAPALAFAKALQAETLLLENPCGHVGPGCEREKVTAAVKQFLEE